MTYFPKPKLMYFGKMILEHRIKAKPDHQLIKVIKEYSSLPLVECYAGQLNQVFMNILANAINALEESMFISNTPENPQIHIHTQLLVVCQDKNDGL